MPFSPINHRTIHNTAQPAANTNIMPVDSNTAGDRTASMFILEIAMSNAGALSAAITNGGNTQVVLLNQGVNLVAGALYTFNILVDEDDNINFRYSVTSGTIQILRLQEVETN